MRGERHEAKKTLSACHVRKSLLGRSVRRVGSVMSSPVAARE